MGESRCRVAVRFAGRGLLWAGGRCCCAVCALGDMKLWRGSCFDVHSSIHRKSCPAKIGLWGSYQSLGSWSVGGSTNQRIPAKKRTRVGTSSCCPGPSYLFFLCRPCATGRSQEIIDGTIAPESFQPGASCSTTTTQLRGPSSMLQPTTLYPSSNSRHMTKATHTQC